MVLIVEFVKLIKLIEFIELTELFESNPQPNQLIQPEQRTAEYRMSNRRMSKEGIASLCLF